MIRLHGGQQLSELDREAVAAADQIWLEVEPDPAGTPLLAELGVDRDRALSVVAGEQRWGRVVAACDAVGLDPADLDMLRPWLAAQTLESKLERESTDDLLRELAGDRVRYEMTLEGAVRLFAGLDDDTQLGLLDWSLELIDGARDWPPEEQQARLRQVAPGFHQLALVARNRAWLLRIEDLRDAGTSAFISVGALHLVGDDGIPALLARRGLSLAE